MDKKLENRIPTIEPSFRDSLHFKTDVNHLHSEYHHLFFINRIEDFRDKMAFPLPPHRKVVNDLIFLTKGSSIRSKGLQNYSFGKNDFFFLPRYQITSHDNMSEDAEGYFIHFSLEIFSEFKHKLKNFSFLNYTDNPVVTIPEHKEIVFIEIFNRLIELNSNHKKKDLDFIVFYLLVLFSEVNLFVEKQQSNSIKNKATLITEEYKNALTQYIYEKQTVQEYAKLLFITPNHLNKSVKATLNRTAQSLLNEMLIMEAKSLLKYSNLSIAEIAERLCKQMPSNFSRFFKSQTGLTPKQYITN